MIEVKGGGGVYYIVIDGYCLPGARRAAEARRYAEKLKRTNARPLWSTVPCRRWRDRA